MSYEPPAEILRKYADVLVNYGLNDGAGVKPGEVVLLTVPDCAKPMLVALRRAVLKAGAHPLLRYYPDGVERDFYELANDEQLTFFPAAYAKGVVEQADHAIHIEAETDKHALEGIPPERIMRRSVAFKPMQEWQEEKEARGDFHWTIGLYGTEKMAKEVGTSLEEYWEQIIKACYLDEEDPVAKWRSIQEEIDRVKKALDAMEIDSLHFEAEGTDLVIGLGEGRQWLGATGSNIPSFEVYTSPDWRRTEGTVTFTEPLYRYGNRITGVTLRFEKGVVVEAHAEEGEEVLKEMLAVENADKAGEISLTDGGLSRITHFMAETLYDENVGGPNGNFHLALGRAYKDAHPDKPSDVPKKEWDRLGYNESVVHTDIVSTAPRTVTATLADGSERIIYEDGKFTF